MVVTVDAVVDAEMLRDDIGGGISAGGVEVGLGGGRRGGGEDKRVDCTGGGSMSETGISETSPAFPSNKGDRVEGGDGCSCSITIQLRRGELVRNGEAVRSGDAKSKAFEGTEDVRVWDERSGDDERLGRVSRSGIRLNVDVFRTRGGDFCINSRGLEDELGPGPVLEDGPGCGSCSEAYASW